MMPSKACSSFNRCTVYKLTENGYQIPDDLSIVGTDDSSLSHLGNKKLTTLTHPKEKLGQDAARWIVTTIEKGQAQPNILYEPVLVERGHKEQVQNTVSHV